ncbi:MAG: TetR/AcrR family transcriptional regulator [Solirubrobacteraceae bacterium]
MAKPVKSRGYESPLRREQAAATRRRILTAAQELLERDGYVATSMAAIAAAAGVSLKTVYLAFDTKSGVLRALWHLLLRGEQDAVPVGEQDWYQAVLEEPHPERQLRLNMRNSVRVKTRAGAMLEVIRDAASMDPDIGALWARIQIEFHDNQRAVVQSIADHGALTPDLDVVAAADILWALNHPNVYALLVGERGWSAERYERWLGDLLCAELLKPDARRSP